MPKSISRETPLTRRSLRNEAYADIEGDGVRPPKGSDEHFVQTFIGQNHESMEWTRDPWREVRDMQKRDPIAKQAWLAYVDHLGKGVRDLSKQSADFLEEFIARYRAGHLPSITTDCEVTVAESAREMVRLVMEMRRTEADARGAWLAYVRAHCNGDLDPQNQPDTTLEDFVARYDSNENFEQYSEAVHKFLDLQVTHGQAFTSAWQRQLEEAGGCIADPAEHCDEVVAEFTDNFEQQLASSGSKIIPVMGGIDPQLSTLRRHARMRALGRAHTHRCSVRLTGLPVEYTAKHLQELHEAMPFIDTPRMAYAQFSEDPGSHGTQVAVLKYDTESDAQRVAPALHGKAVMDQSGNILYLSAELGVRMIAEVPLGPFDVYITDIPNSFDENSIRQWHIEKDLPDSIALVSVQWLPPKDPSINILSCIAHYHDRSSARAAAVALRGYDVSSDLGVVGRLTVTMARQAGPGSSSSKPSSSWGSLPIGVPLKGILETWEEDRNKDRSFGFIRPEGGGLEVFAPRACIIGKVPPAPGLQVTFAIRQPTAQGGLKAEWCRGCASVDDAAAQDTSQAHAKDMDPKDNVYAEFPPLLQTFGQLWGLKPDTVKWLARFPGGIQQQVAEQFDPEDSSGGADLLDKKLRSFAYSVKSKFRG